MIDLRARLLLIYEEITISGFFFLIEKAGGMKRLHTKQQGQERERQ